MRFRVFTVLALLLAAASATFADFAPLRSADAPEAAASSHAAPAPTPAELTWLVDAATRRLFDVPSAVAPSDAFDASWSGPPSREPKVETLPAAPSSFSLGLTALLGLGAYQATRSLRKLNLGSLPEWYHSGGPQQIGHATPYDLDGPPVAVCVLDTPAWSTGLNVTVSRLADRILSPPHRVLAVTAPRGPPQLS